MPADQIKLLNSLAKEIKMEKKEKDKVLVVLQSAKILTKDENFSGKFSNLKRVVPNSQ